MNQDAFADRIECLFPNSFSALSACFALPQRVFSFLALGDVDYVRQNKRAFISANRIQTDLDRYFASIFVAAIQIAARAHRSRRRLMKEFSAMTGMSGAIALRHQQFHRLAEQLGSRVTKKFFGLCVDESYATVVIDHQHRARRRLDDQSNSFLGGADGFQQPLVIKGQRGQRRQIFKPLFIFVGERMRRAISDDERAQHFATRLERRKREVAHAFGRMYHEILGWKFVSHAEAFDNRCPISCE